MNWGKAVEASNNRIVGGRRRINTERRASATVRRLIAQVDYYQHGKSVKEISDKLGVTERAVYYYLSGPGYGVRTHNAMMKERRERVIRLCEAYQQERERERERLFRSTPEPDPEKLQAFFEKLREYNQANGQA